MRNICVVGPSKKFLSGISYHTIRLANALDDNYNVGVICFRNLLPTQLFPGSKHVGKQLSPLDFKDGIIVFDGMDYNSPGSWFAANRFLKRFQPDAIILQWWSSTVAHMHVILKTLNKRNFKSKILLDIHEVIDPLEGQMLPVKLYSRIAGNLLRRNLDGYIVHSHADIETLSKTYNIDKNKIYVIPMGLYDHYGPPMDQKKAKKILGIEEKYVVLNFGLIRKYKGVHHLIDAFEKLEEDVAKNIRLLIVGEVWDHDLNIQDRISNNKYSKNITFLDKYVSDEDVKIYFSAADMLVLPYTRSSGSGISLIGMAFSKPIAVSKIGALAENLADYEGTVFINPNDPADIAQNIKKVISKGQIRIQPPDISWDNIALKYKDVFDKIS